MIKQKIILLIGRSEKVSVLKNIINKNKDKLIKKAQIVCNHRDEISKVIKYIQWKDISHGEIIITEEIFNTELKPIILEEIKEYVTDLNITIEEGRLSVFLSGKYKSIPFNVKYKIVIEEFEFNNKAHKISLKYEENINSVGWLNNKIAIGIISGLLYGVMGKTFIEKGISNEEGISFNENTIVADLDKIPKFCELNQKNILGMRLLPLINLTLIGCEEQKLKFKLTISNPR